LFTLPRAAKTTSKDYTRFDHARTGYSRPREARHPQFPEIPRLQRLLGRISDQKFSH